MRALVCNEYGSTDALEIEEQADPVAGPGEIVVDVAAAGINFPDILAIAGKYQVKTEPPFIPGNEAAGTVSAVGGENSRFSVGDTVVFMSDGGAFAEKCKANESAAVHLPKGLSLEQGAGFTVTYGTSYHALKQSASLQPDETVLVLGAAGGVGITAVEIAKAMGAHVIAAASSEEKLDFARSAGADETINYSDVPTQGDREATDRRQGRGCHLRPCGRRTCRTGHTCAGVAWPLSCYRFCLWPHPEISGQYRTTQRSECRRCMVGNLGEKNPKTADPECAGTGGADSVRDTESAGH